MKNAFRGHLPRFSASNEMAAWTYIEKLADAALAKYPTTLKEDQDMLKKDDSEHLLSFNKRNCILFRKREKDLLYFLKDCKDRAHELLNMNKESATEEICTWSYYNDCFIFEYFRTLVNQLC